MGFVAGRADEESTRLLLVLVLGLGLGGLIGWDDPVTGLETSRSSSSVKLFCSRKLIFTIIY